MYIALLIIAGGTIVASFLPLRTFAEERTVKS